VYSSDAGKWLPSPFGEALAGAPSPSWFSGVFWAGRGIEAVCHRKKGTAHLFWKEVS
jgi:hypothetical protein